MCRQSRWDNGIFGKELHMSAPMLDRPVSRTGAGRPRVSRPVVPPELRRSDNPAAAVLRTAASGPVSRDNSARATGLSIATVNRQVASLLSAGLLRERPDLTAAGAVGRPRVPFEID